MQMPFIYPIAFSGPVASIIPHQFFDLSALVPAAPAGVIEYDWVLKKPSANDVCDGTLTIYAWLHLTDRIVYDSHLTVVIERWILPQKFVVKYELDTHVENEVEYCPTWRGIPKDRQPVPVKGFEYNHILPMTIDEDPPNTDGEKMESTTTFKWKRDLVPLGSIVSPGGLFTPPVSVHIGLGHESYAGNIHWILDLKTNLSEYDGIVQESAVVFEDPALTEDFFCYVASDDNSATYKNGEGEAMFSAGFRESNRFITTP